MKLWPSLRIGRTMRKLRTTEDDDRQIMLSARSAHGTASGRAPPSGGLQSMMAAEGYGVSDLSTSSEPDPIDDMLDYVDGR